MINTYVRIGQIKHFHIRKILPAEFFCYYRISFTNIIKLYREGGSALKILTGKPIGKRPLRRPRHRWEDNIRMEFKEISISTGNWFNSAQDRDSMDFIHHAVRKVSDFFFCENPVDINEGSLHDTALNLHTYP